MTKYKMCLIATLFVVIFFIAKTYACGCGGGSFGYAPQFSASIPIVVAPRPEFNFKWKAEDIVSTFKNHQLTVEELESITEATNRYPIFKSVNEAIRFNLPSFGLDEGVYIHTFIYIDDLKTVQKHFLDLNKKGELYTWSFIKDNVVLIVSGKIPENIARQYESALNSIRT